MLVAEDETVGRLPEGELVGDAVGERDPLFDALLETVPDMLRVGTGLDVPVGVCSATEGDALADALAEGVIGAEAEPDGDAVGEREADTEVVALTVADTDADEIVELEALGVCAATDGDVLADELVESVAGAEAVPEGDKVGVREADVEEVPEMVGGATVAVAARDGEPVGVVAGVRVALIDPVEETVGRREDVPEAETVGVREPLFDALLEAVPDMLRVGAVLDVPLGVWSATEGDALADALAEGVIGAEADSEGDAVGVREADVDGVPETVDATDAVAAPTDAEPVGVAAGELEALIEPVEETLGLRDAVPEAVRVGVLDVVSEGVAVGVLAKTLDVADGELVTLTETIGFEGEALAEPVPVRDAETEGVLVAGCDSVLVGKVEMVLVTEGV